MRKTGDFRFLSFTAKSLIARLGSLCLLLLLIPFAAAQYVAPYVIVQGSLSTAGGVGAQNATITFNPSQVFFVAGTSVVVSETQCATDASGSVVGIGNPLTGVRVSPQYAGTLPAGNYYIKFSWYDQFSAQTVTSPEVAVQLTAAGELHILPPVGNGPPSATGMNVYIGTAPGQETYQGQTTSTTAEFLQATPLTTGTALPIANNTSCRVVANDAGWPTGTGYQVSLVDASGNTLFAYPEMWQFLGPGSTYNLSQGIPYYHGQVTYPVPILTIPYNHNMQSISGPLSMGQPGGPGYSIVNLSQLGVGTAIPAWGVDVEGTGLLGQVNAATGYLYAGQAPNNHVLLGNGTAYVDSATIPYSILSDAPILRYQTVINGSHATDAVTQRQYLAVGPGTGLVASDAVGVGTQVFRTVLNVNAIGGSASTSNDPYVVVTAGGGTAGNCMQWDSTIGGAADAGHPCAVYYPFTGTSGYQIFPSGIIFEWGQTVSFDTGPISQTLPMAFPHACFVGFAIDNTTNGRIYTAACSGTTALTIHNNGSSTGNWFAIGW